MPEVRLQSQDTGPASPAPSCIRRDWQTLPVRVPELRIGRTRTLDGMLVRVVPKIKALTELPGIKAHGAVGVGVLRSDRLIEVHGRNEEEQAAVYRHLCEYSEGEPLVIQTVLHGPRVVAALDKVPFNPVNLPLGELGARFSLGTGRDLFVTQLRAILRGAADHQVEIVLPMVSNLREITAAKETIQEVSRQLCSEGIAHNTRPRFGITIETVAAVLILRDCMPYLDSVSVPSTRLIGRTVATDRRNGKVAHLHEAVHPAGVRLLQEIVNVVADKPVRVGGEMVNNIDCGAYPASPILVPLLLGLGVREFNPRPELVPAVKLLVMRTDLTLAMELAREVAKLATANAIRTRCIEFARDAAPELFLE